MGQMTYMSDSYYANFSAREKWLKDNPTKTAQDWIYEATDIKDEYIDAEMEAAGYVKDHYMGSGAWMWRKV